MTPLVLLVGFLGSGKTTLLRKTLPALKERGITSKVILNDYQNARVDSAALSELVDAIVPIAGSCVCCESREELLNELANSAPKKGEILLLETNGTTDSMQLIEMIFLNPVVKELYHPVIQVTVVDAKRWQKRVWHNELERLQVKTATHLLLSWQDQVGGGRLGHVRRELQALNHQAEFVDHASLIDELVASLNAEPQDSHDHHHEEGEHCDHCDGHHHTHDDEHHDHDHGDHHDHHHMAHGFVSLQFEPSAEITREELIAWWREMPESILRIKGTIPLRGESSNHWYFQGLAGNPDLHLEEMNPKQEATTLIVLIAYGMTEDELQTLAKRLEPATA